VAGAVEMVATTRAFALGSQAEFGGEAGRGGGPTLLPLLPVSSLGKSFEQSPTLQCPSCVLGKSSSPVERHDCSRQLCSSRCH